METDWNMIHTTVIVVGFAWGKWGGTRVRIDELV
jgi:hypothetical protein